MISSVGLLNNDLLCSRLGSRSKAEVLKCPLPLNLEVFGN